MTCGIYFIRSPSGKMYVGSSIRAEKRCIQHLSDLRTGRHPSRRLSMAFVKYSGEGFESGILEECLPEQLEEREQFWIDTLKPRYNSRLSADSNTGLRMTEAERVAHAVAMKDFTANDPEFRAHLAEQNELNWADPEKKAARIASMKAAWTPEKRAELSTKQKGVDKGKIARTARWDKPGAGKHQSKLLSQLWDKRGRKNTPETIKAKVEEFGWKCLEIGPPSKPGGADGRVTIHCLKHNYTGTPTVAKLMYQGQGCRHCGHARSSEKQLGQRKTPQKRAAIKAAWTSEKRAEHSALMKEVSKRPS